MVKFYFYVSRMKPILKSLLLILKIVDLFQLFKFKMLEKHLISDTAQSLDDIIHEFLAHSNTRSTGALQQHMKNLAVVLKSLPCSTPSSLVLISNALEEDIKAVLDCTCKCGRTVVITSKTKDDQWRFLKCNGPDCNKFLCWVDDLSYYSAEQLRINIPLHLTLLLYDLKYYQKKHNVSNEGYLDGINPHNISKAHNAVLHLFRFVSMCYHSPKVLPSILFTDPQPSFDWIVKLTVDLFNNITNAYSNVVIQSKKHGVFDIAQLERVKPNEGLPDSHELLQFLIRLLVIVELPDSSYLIPCVLETIENPMDTLHRAHGRPFFLSCEVDSTVLEGLFACLLVHLIRLPEFFLLSKSALWHRNHIELKCTKFGGKLVLIQTDDLLGFVYTGDTCHYPSVFQLIKKEICLICERFGRNMIKSYQTKVPCPLRKCKQDAQFHTAWINSDNTCITCDISGNTSKKQMQRVCPWISKSDQVVPVNKWQSPNKKRKTTVKRMKKLTYSGIRSHFQELTGILADSDTARFNLTRELFSRHVIDKHEKQEIDKLRSPMKAADELVSHIMNRINTKQAAILKAMKNIESLKNVLKKIKEDSPNIQHSPPDSPSIQHSPVTSEEESPSGNSMASGECSSTNQRKDVSVLGKRSAHQDENVPSSKKKACSHARACHCRPGNTKRSSLCPKSQNIKAS